MKSLITSTFKQFKKCANSDSVHRETLRPLLSRIYIQFKGFINQTLIGVAIFVFLCNLKTLKNLVSTRIPVLCFYVYKFD